MNLFRTFKRRSKTEIALYSFVSIIFAVVAASYLYLLVWAVLAGLKDHTEIVMEPFGLPSALHWRNYIDVFHKLEVGGNDFVDMLFNSVYFSVVGTLLRQFIIMTFAYCCTRYKFPGSTLPYTIILIMMTLPLYGRGGAQYILFSKLGLVDSYLYPLSAIGDAFSMVYLYYRAYFINMTGAYVEAAKIDGAGDFQCYFRIMMPMTKPLFGAMFLTGWLGSWNEYEGAMVYLPSLPTLPVGIYQFNTEMIYQGRLDILFAACVIVSIPAIVLFTAFNKLITTSVSIGGLKG